MAWKLGAIVGVVLVVCSVSLVILMNAGLPKDALPLQEEQKTTKNEPQDLDQTQYKIPPEIPDILEYYKIQRSWMISFDHAVNSRALLMNSVHKNTHIIEADVLYGNIQGDSSDARQKAIMAHPPNTTSDISFDDWIEIALDSGKALKLDFKSLNVVLPALYSLRKKLFEHQDQQKTVPPIWLNADIVSGLEDDKPTVQGFEFIRLCNQLVPFAPLSLGWTLDPTKKYETAVYSQEMVEQMHSFIGVMKKPITFAVRFSMVQRSWEQLKWLLDKSSEQFSLSIFHCKVDDISEEHVSEVFKLTQDYKVFFDLDEFSPAVQSKSTN